MDNAAATPQVTDVSDEQQGDEPQDANPVGEELRTAPRYNLLIRAAKLVTPHGEFVCVVRDVSETGLAARLFHKMPSGNPIELHMPGGCVYELRLAREDGNEVGFEFTKPVDVAQLIHEVGEYPKRGLRLGVCFPIKVTTLTQSCQGVVENLSQQGARFACEGLFAIDQNLRIKNEEGGPSFKDVRAKVRWRRDDSYGVVFDDTLTLSDFARFAALLQCPTLLD